MVQCLRVLLILQVLGILGEFDIGGSVILSSSLVISILFKNGVFSQLYVIKCGDEFIFGWIVYFDK